MWHEIPMEFYLDGRFLRLFTSEQHRSCNERRKFSIPENSLYYTFVPGNQFHFDRDSSRGNL